jgi:hypothetical protein
MTNAVISLTAKHEARGYLVQGQCLGKFMILHRSEEAGWVRAAKDFSSYIAACEEADRMTELLAS